MALADKDSVSNANTQAKSFQNDELISKNEKFKHESIWSVKNRVFNEIPAIQRETDFTVDFRINNSIFAQTLYINLFHALDHRMALSSQGKESKRDIHYLPHRARS